MVLLLMRSVLSVLASSVPLPVTARFDSVLEPLSATVSARVPAPSESVPPVIAALDRFTWAPAPNASTKPVRREIGKTIRVVFVTVPSMVRLASLPTAASSPLLVTLLTMVTPCAVVPSIRPELPMVRKPVLRVRPALTPLPMMLASLLRVRLAPIVPEPSMVLPALVRVFVNKNEKNGNGKRGARPAMALWESSLSWTTPLPLRMVLLAIMKSVAWPAELSVIFPVLSNVPPVSSAPVSATLIVPALAPVPVVPLVTSSR